MNRNYLILIGLGVATILALVLINAFSGSGTDDVQLQQQLDDYLQEIETLESEVLETSVINEYTINELNSLKGLLEEKYTQLNFYEQKIKDLEKSGVQNETEISNLKQKLVEYRQRLSGATIKLLRTEIDVLVEDYTDLTKATDSIVLNRQRSDSTIFALRRQLRNSESDFKDCMDAKGLEVPTNPQRPQLNASITGLQMINSKTGQAGDKRLKRIETANMNKFKVYFDLTGEFIDSGSKTLYLVVRHNDGKYYRSIRSRDIEVEGKTVTYVSDAIVEYKSGVKNEVAMEFELPEGVEVKKGGANFFIVYKGEFIEQHFALIL
ncbi:MAG: hypothetical protein AAFP89_03700 [Bacteroidota bacterium]